MTGAGSGTLGTIERRSLAAVCDALLPSLVPEEGDAAGLFARSAGELGVAEAAAQAMQSLSARQSRELRLFLRLLGSPLFMLLVSGHFTAFATLTGTRREKVLLAMANSPLPQVRTGFQALKRLATFLFYTVVDASGRNPNWSDLGYELPDRKTAGSALRLRQVNESTTLDADVCVIGSGAGGAVVAAQLAAAGRTVIVLEAGPSDQAGEFDQREIVGMQRLYLDQGTTATRDLSVAILAGSSIGGGTTVNWQTSLRTPDFVLAEWAERSGVHALGGDAFATALDAVCARLNVGTTESVRNANNAPLERGCAALGFRWTELPRNAKGCDLTQCGFCVFGCRVGGKQSSATTFLHDAQRTGRTTIVSSCRAERLLLERGQVTGVQAVVRDDTTGAPHALRIRSRMTIVAAGALETPALLLRSGIEHPQIGRNLFLHPTTSVAGEYEELVRGWMGAPQSVLCDHFDRTHGTYGFRLETAPVHPGLTSFAYPWFGARDHRLRMQRLAHVSAFVVLTRDRNPGRVSIDREGRAVMDYPLGAMERGLLQDGIAAAARVHWAAGARRIHTLHSRQHAIERTARSGAEDIDAFCRTAATLPVHGNRCGVFSAHQMGTCRMGSDPRASVCDHAGEVRGVRGLHVADASLFPGSSGVNPMITTMALAHMVGSTLAARS